MRQVRKTILSIMIIFSLTNIFRCEIILANPIPYDGNWEASPVPSNYNGSIFLKQEHLNITFDDSKAHVEATYVFKNTNATGLNLTILLPFANYACESHKPEISSIKLDGETIDYLWTNNSYHLKSFVSTCSYYYVKYNITFSAFEERIIIIDYLRDYMKHEPIDSCDKTYYNYIYTVGSARAWNHSIELARFELWIPKSICDNFNWGNSITKLGKNISSVASQQDYYMASLQYNDWIPPSDEDILFLSWSKTKSWYDYLICTLFFHNPLVGIFFYNPLLGILIVFSVLAFLLIIVINFKYRRKRDSTC